MLQFQLPFLNQALNHCIWYHHERHSYRHHREHPSCSIDISPEVDWKRQWVLGEVEAEFRIFEDVSHHGLQSHWCVRYRCRLAACIDEDSDGVEPILTVNLLEEEVTILSAILVSMIVYVVIDLLDLVEEVFWCVCCDCYVFWEELTWTYISPKIALNVIRNFTVGLVEVM